MRACGEIQDCAGGIAESRIADRSGISNGVARHLVCARLDGYEHLKLRSRAEPNRVNVYGPDLDQTLTKTVVER
jgi:hypothetical protein